MTRFYFSPLESTGVTVATDPGWTNFNATNPKGKLRVEPVGSSGFLLYKQTKTVATNPTNAGIIQFTSDPMPGSGSVPSGTTVNMVIPMKEAAAADDAMIRLMLRIVSNDGSTVRGLLYVGPSNTTVSSDRSQPNYEFSAVEGMTRRLLVTTTATINWQVGDRLVAEIGARFVQATSSGEASAWFTPNATVSDYALATDNDLDPIKRPWLEVVGIDFFPLTNMVPEEFRFTQGGYPLNNQAATLPFVDLESIDGLDSPLVRMSSANREGQHGSFVTAEFEGERTVTLEGVLYTSPSDLETELNDLKANFAPTPTDQKLYFMSDDDVLRFVNGKSTGLRYRKVRERSFGVVRFQVQIICQDPRIYTGTDVTVTTSQSFTVSGNRETPVVYTGKAITAVTTGTWFEHQTLEGTFRYTYNAAMVAGDVLTLDVEARTALLNGTTNVRDKVEITPNWGYLQAGVLNTYTQRDATSVFEVTKTYSPAWR